MIKKPKKPVVPKVFIYEKQTIETFHKPGTREIASLKCESADCGNGNVSIRRYKITFEEIPEPKDVLAKRLQSLWDHSETYHDSEPLKSAAIELGYELQGDRGSKRKK